MGGVIARPAIMLTLGLLAMSGGQVTLVGLGALLVLAGFVLIAGSGAIIPYLAAHIITKAVIGGLIMLAGALMIVGGSGVLTPGYLTGAQSSERATHEEPMVKGISTTRPEATEPELTHKEATKEETTQEPQWGKLGGNQEGPKASASVTPTPTASPTPSSPPSSEDQSSDDFAMQTAPVGPVGHEPYQNQEGTYRSYTTLPHAEVMQAYLDAAEAGDYDTMYSMLSLGDQKHYTLEEWRYANDAISTDQSTYELAGTLVIGDEEGLPPADQAVVEITVPNGEVVTKYWWFAVNVDDQYRHWLNAEEVELLDGALAGS